MKQKSTSVARKVGTKGCLCLELTHPGARSIALAGSFNEWHPTATPMVALGEGRWRKELSLPSGRYEYRLVVDGQWADDRTAKETVPNPFGGLNAVVTVETQ